MRALEVVALVAVGGVALYLVATRKKAAPLPSGVAQGPTLQPQPPATNEYDFGIAAVESLAPALAGWLSSSTDKQDASKAVDKSQAGVTAGSAAPVGSVSAWLAS